MVHILSVAGSWQCGTKVTISSHHCGLRLLGSKREGLSLLEPFELVIDIFLPQTTSRASKTQHNSN